MLGPDTRSRASLAFAIVVTALGGSVLLSSGTSSSAAAPVVRPMGPAVPAPPVRPLLLAPVLPVLRVEAPPMGPATAAPQQVGPAGTVGPGSHPRQVRQVQRLLNARGAGLRVDGAWGPATTRAVRGLQLQAGLSPSGRVDARTAAALRH